MRISDAFAHLSDRGDLSGSTVEKSEKRFADASSWYRFKDGLDPDTLLYEVYTYSRGEALPGNLNVGVTVLKPLTIGGECNMTRGHWHINRECAEVYRGVHGEGLLLLMDESGCTWAERVEPGSIHIIDGKLAHRLVNTGDEDLKVAAVWDCGAGHDYDAVDTTPFGFRVVRDQDGRISFMPTDGNASEVHQ